MDFLTSNPLWFYLLSKYKTKEFNQNPQHSPKRESHKDYYYSQSGNSNKTIKYIFDNTFCLCIQLHDSMPPRTPYPFSIQSDYRKNLDSKCYHPESIWAVTSLFLIRIFPVSSLPSPSQFTVPFRTYPQGRRKFSIRYSIQGMYS